MGSVTSPFPLYSQPLRCRCARHLRQAGFTLLELLLVIVIAGITLGLVSLNAMPSEQQTLQKEAQRIALLMQLARDEAIVRDRPIAFEAAPYGYRFVLREGNGWTPLVQEDILRERRFERPPVTLSIEPAAATAGNPLRIVFGREPVDKPFVLILAAGNGRVAIHADGIGHYEVEQNAAE